MKHVLPACLALLCLSAAPAAIQAAEEAGSPAIIPDAAAYQLANLPQPDHLPVPVLAPDQEARTQLVRLADVIVPVPVLNPHRPALATP